jgi:2-polyprenyl-6-methoxyphenol hydroxylase-like FAD-dependent oxidoreductase
MILPRTPASKQTVGLQLKDALTNQCFERTACFVVGADGVKSKVREIMEQDTSALEALSGARLRSFKFEGVSMYLRRVHCTRVRMLTDVR